MQRVWVQSLVGELRYYMQCGMGKNEKKKDIFSHCDHRAIESIVF